MKEGLNQGSKEVIINQTKKDFFVQKNKTKKMQDLTLRFTEMMVLESDSSKVTVI